MASANSTGASVRVHHAGDDTPELDGVHTAADLAKNKATRLRALAGGAR